ncbi:Acetyl esterase/lipase [Bifidobacterium bohemicum]|uniref:Endo-1,4-beta-xylanase n=1 Tax=Bifidobacterium bohemicum DSM 22767 TaxID=1437606 RepID=A0A086ZEL0_9BIFI|nr:alpha/beta hydrolase [Bifidobacterium bohemicum]KFI44960.1 endo-1,4-beta-xylanase [Bifidobacterium bohemicum DSM 22767]SCC12153.1 Acetyl esterase/lipase [Bifidobacterium bohemicum]
MKYIRQTIEGTDGSRAEFDGYIIDNSKEIDENRVRPAVLVIPGGGYEMTSDREAEPIALKMLGAGFHAFVLRYSCSPSVYPTALLEAAQAMAIIREHAAEWHVDPNAVIILGFSAGGHLAANLATDAGDETERAHGYDPDAVRPNGLALSYAVLTSGEFAHRSSIEHLLGDKKDDPAMLEEVSCEQHVSAKTPPTFLWHTATDGLVPVQNSMLLANACVNAGVSVEMHLYPQGGHGLSLGTLETAWGGDLANVEPCIQTWPDLLMDWITRNFAK